MQETDWKKALADLLERRQMLEEAFEHQKEISQHRKSAKHWSTEDTALMAALDTNLLAEIAVRREMKVKGPKRAAKANGHAKDSPTAPTTASSLRM